ncbi:SO_0444 family Cu/Zn efflux transporter [bacterium]|nr:SO_0444 family Cu/Zn efflux transporter [bacterium]
MQAILSQAQLLLESLWTTSALMAPYLLLGFLIAGILHVLIPEAWIEKHLGGRGLWPVTKASLVGVPIPICSCGVIPVAAGLRRNGASRGSTVSFLLSTPQTGVDSIAITWGMLGPVFAIYRTLAAFISGIVGGLLADLLGDDGDPAVKEHKHSHNGHAHSHASTLEDDCGHCSPATAPRSGNRLLQALHYGFVTLPRDLARNLLFGLLLAAVFNVFIPDHALPENIGSGIVGYLALMALGIPLYVCATGSVPMVVPLLAKGIISPGAALVFLVSGPATNLASIATLWRILGRRTSIIYLLTVAGLSLLSGYVLDAFLPSIELGGFSHLHIEELNWMHHLSALLLGAMLIAALLPPQRSQSAKQAQSGETPGDATVLEIRGMTCSHCSSSAEKALAGQPGVSSVTVDLHSGTAVVSGEDLQVEQLIEAVDSIGFHASRRG